MIAEPNCSKRKCKHYLGVNQPDGTEFDEFHYCDAYPNGIPERIAYEEEKHLTVQSDQESKIVYEKESQ